MSDMLTGVDAGVKVFSDQNEFEVLDSRKVIVEERGQKVKRTRLTGVIQKCDELNENRRRYGSGVLKEAVDAIQDNLQSRRVLGELDHPSDAKIHIDRVSHLMSKVWMEDKRVMGEVEVLDKLPCGKILMGLIESNIPVSISSRGVGDMEPIVTENFGEEAYEVLPGYRFVTWDIVAEPSVTEAQLSVMESIQRRSRDKKWTQKKEAKFLDEFRKAIRGMKG